MIRLLKPFAPLGLAALLASPVFADVPDTKSTTPVDGITKRMGGVARELALTETGEPVQAEQGLVIRDLDVLIAELEKECQACKNGIKKNNPTRPLPDSVIRSGTGGMGDMGSPGTLEKDWGKLSEGERDRILQSMSEGFPPEYRTVLERYYRRLAEEKTAAPATDATPTPAADLPAAPEATDGRN